MLSVACVYAIGGKDARPVKLHGPSDIRLDCSMIIQSRYYYNNNIIITVRMCFNSYAIILFLSLKGVHPHRTLVVQLDSLLLLDLQSVLSWQSCNIVVNISSFSV